MVTGAAVLLLSTISEPQDSLYKFVIMMLCLGLLTSLSPEFLFNYSTPRRLIDRIFLDFFHKQENLIIALSNELVSSSILDWALLVLLSLEVKFIAATICFST